MNGQPGRPRRGVTLIELLVVLGVIAVLAGILLPVLSRAALLRHELVCITRVRSMGTMIQSYGIDHKDSFPSFIPGGIDYNADRSRWSTFSNQANWYFTYPQWSEYTGFATTNETQYCPSNDWYPHEYTEIAAPDFWLTSSGYIRPDFLDPRLDPAVALRELGGRVQKHHATRFPSAKVGVFEIFVWHGWKGEHCEGCPVGDLEYHGHNQRRGSIFFLDGHADGRFEREAVRAVRRWPTWAPYTYMTTPNGLHGRDFE